MFSTKEYKENNENRTFASPLHFKAVKTICVLWVPYVLEAVSFCRACVDLFSMQRDLRPTLVWSVKVVDP